MARTERELAHALGSRIRQARIDGRLRQVDVARHARTSQSTVCRLESGRGGAIPLGTWWRVADAAGLDLETAFDASELVTPDSPERRICALLVDEAARGGWSASTLIGGGVTEVFLQRPAWKEVVVVRVWRGIGDVDGAIDGILERARQERSRRGHEWIIRCLVLIARSTEGRRRWTECQQRIDATFPEIGARWLIALRSPTGRMPLRDGLLWVDRNLTRIRPTIPEVDRRRRGRRRSGG